MASTPLVLPALAGTSPGPGRRPQCSGGLWREEVDAAVRGDRGADPAGGRQDPDGVLIGHLRGQPACVGALVLRGELLADRGLYGAQRCADVPDLIGELAGRPASVSARLGYLLSGLLSDTESQKLGLRPSGSVVWFGPRATVRRTDRFWGVVDTVLPEHPSQVARLDHGAGRRQT
jgi:hypothetical protein